MNIHYVDCLLPFHLLYRAADSLEVSNMDKQFVKSKLWKFALSLYKVSGKILEKNLPKNEFNTLKRLLKNKDLLTQKADNVTTVLILNRNESL